MINQSLAVKREWEKWLWKTWRSVRFPKSLSEKLVNWEPARDRVLNMRIFMIRRKSLSGEIFWILKFPVEIKTNSMQKPNLTCRWWSPWKWKSSSGPNFALPIGDFKSKVIFIREQQADTVVLWLLTYLELSQTVFGVLKELWGEPNHLLLRHLLVLLDDDRQPLTIYHVYIWSKIYLHVLLDDDVR